jgi:NAD(P)-dependent dehydrogenase (short-subunit alcohol dehydrogenase family)
MRILLIGASGTIGKRLINEFSRRHKIITAGRTSGDVQVDITSEESIKQMFENLEAVDSCICVAASGAMDNFQTLTQSTLLENMQGKFFGQTSLVLIGQHYLNPHGNFVLTTGIFADQPAKGVTGGGVISGALHSFVLSAAIELKNGLRINAVSPGMTQDSFERYGELFPNLKPVPMKDLVAAYVEYTEKPVTGQIARIY